MILMYHKIDIVTPSYWWISSKTFAMQIDALVDAGYEFSYLEDFRWNDDRQAILTFDDAYENIYRYAFPLLRDKHIPFEVFVIGNYIAEWNDFDQGEPRTRFCSLEQLEEMADYGARIQWHTRDHPNLTQIEVGELELQLSINSSLLSIFKAPHLRWFAYPYGIHDQFSVDRVSEQFDGAVSVNNGTMADRFQLNRVTVDESWMPSETAGNR